MKSLFALIILSALLIGCNTDVDITPKVKDATYSTESYQVIIGSLDGVFTDFRASEYQCNAGDLLLYSMGGAAVLNTDSTQVSCSTNAAFRVDIKNSLRPLYKG